MEGTTRNDYWSCSPELVATLLDTQRSGLTEPAVRERTLRYGKNILAVRKRQTIWSRLWKQLTDFMILILIAAACISGFAGDLADTIVIIAIVILNAVIGLVQESRAENAMAALVAMSEGTARVIRDGTSREVPNHDLVPGDVVTVEAGNVLPADLRFIETQSLNVDESALTGESANVEKTTSALPEGNYPLSEKIMIGFKGTFVTSGHGSGYVIATGMQTEMGRIAELVQQKEIATPLQKRLNDFSKRLTLVILSLCFVFFIIGWFRGETWPVMLLTSISLAVAAIPEALPAVVTIALSLGAKRLAVSNALIRKLPAVETLGSVTYICSDKTGTLTVNKMTVKDLYEPAGIVYTGTVVHRKDLLLEAMVLNNDVTLGHQGQWLGESTEVALVQYAQLKNFNRATVETEFPRIGEIPFDSKRKCMTTLHRSPHGVVAIVKGGVDVLFGKLTEEQGDRVGEFAHAADAMAGKGFRTIGYCVRFFDEMPADVSPSAIESSLTFIGVAGMIDPPRAEARVAIAECRAAGITPVMITGDHKLTAAAIARDLGIITSEQDIIMEGFELHKLTDTQFDAIVEKVRVYARVDPEQKLRIVNALQSRHQFVAMTGDGVNDAPALRNADIGIAMGINGTDVSKEAAHMILLDDNFATILVAVRHGRRIFDNILKFIKYIMAGNCGELLTLFLAPFFGLPIPLLAIHILWVNLITDGLPGLALAAEPADENIMKRGPRRPNETIFSTKMTLDIIGIGLLIAAVTLCVQQWSMTHEGKDWQTMTFTVLCFSQLGYAMSVRSTEKSLFAIGVFSNKPMLYALVITAALHLTIIYVPLFNRLFKTNPLSWSELAVTIAASSIVFSAAEISKILRNQFAPEKKLSNDH